MRAKLLSLLVAAIVLLACSAALASRGSTAATRPPTVSRALQTLKSSGAITPTAYQQYYSEYLAAGSSLKKLSGTRRTELGAVLANVQAIAAAGGFIPSRLPALFLTLERNRQWWTTKPLLSSSSVSASPAAAWCGSTTPARASRSSGWERSARPTAITCRATRTPTCARC